MKKIVRIYLVYVLLFITFTNCSKKEPQKPNVLFVISDDQSFPHSSAYGESWIQTPGFDRVANEGILFNNAFVTSPGCAPSRASILTGKYPWQIRHAGNHHSLFPSDLTVLPDLLEKNGYFIGYTGKGSEPSWWIMSGRERNPAGPEYNEIEGNYFHNFKTFISKKDENKPFFFWLGTRQPHRRFEPRGGLNKGKILADANVPEFLPDNKIIRSDLLDYANEIEKFDKHLNLTLQYLDSLGMLENTLVIVTSDNGIAMPRAKATCFEYGIHVPLAISWPNQIKPGQKTNFLASTVDLMPSILQACGMDTAGLKLAGKSLLNMLTNGEVKKPIRENVFAGRERHSSSRWLNLGYPQRVVRTDSFLYIKNYYPERWPRGAPQIILANGSLGPLHGEGIEFKGESHGAYFDEDSGPTKTYLIENREDPEIAPYFELAFGKNPGEQLFDMINDPYCLTDLAQNTEYKNVKTKMATLLQTELIATNDPREKGENPDVFESLARYAGIREFPVPDWASSLNNADLAKINNILIPDESPLNMDNVILLDNGLVAWNWKLLEVGDGRFELYNMDEDPQLKRNVFSEYRELRTNMIGFYRYLRVSGKHSTGDK